MKKILFLVLISLFFAIILLQIFGKKTNSIVSRYSNIEAKRFGIYVINYSLDKKFINTLDDDIFITSDLDGSKLKVLDFKSKKVNVILESTTKKLQDTLIDLENGKLSGFDLAYTFKGMRYKNIKNGVVCELPTGVLFSNSLFANTGPVIPIKLNFIGDVLVNLNTHVDTYGINNIYIEVNIHIELTEQITMPMQSKRITIKTDIPLAMKIVEGNIPEYYQPFISKESSSFRLPVK